MPENNQPKKPKAYEVLQTLLKGEKPKPEEVK